MVHVLDELMKAIASRSRLNLQNAFAYPTIYFTNYLWSRTFSRNERLLYLLNYGTKIIKCSVVACVSHFNVEILFSILYFSFLSTYSLLSVQQHYLDPF